MNVTHENKLKIIQWRRDFALIGMELIMVFLFYIGITFENISISTKVIKPVNIT